MNETHFHRRNLPHFYRLNSTYFITYRLKGSLSLILLKELKQKEEYSKDYKSRDDKYRAEKLFFGEYDKLLDQSKLNHFLLNKNISEIVEESLHFNERKKYNLICYTIMPNHVHLVFHLLQDYFDLGKIMQSIKRFLWIVTSYRRLAIGNEK